MKKALHTLILVFLFSPVYHVVAGPNFSRLIGFTTTKYIAPSYVTQDSTHYYYTGTAFSDMKKGIILFDSAIKFNYSSPAYKPYSKNEQIFNIITDSVQVGRGYLWLDSAWSLQSMNFYYRDNNNLDTALIASSNPESPVLWRTQYKYFSVYDASKNLTKQFTFLFDTLSHIYDSSRLSTYTYDASNNLLTASNYAFNPAKGAFDAIDKYTYNYAGGKLAAYQHAHWDIPTSGYAVDLLATINYDGSGRQQTIFYVESDPTTHIIGPSREDSFAYDAASNVIAITNLTYNAATMGYDNAFLSQWTYNTATPNQPLTYTTLTWDGSGFSPSSGDDVKNYYYYEITNDVKQIDNGVVDLQLYPIPAQNYIHINLEWTEAKPFTVSLFDGAGRLVLQNGFESTKSYNGNLQIPQLVSGNYTLVIGDGNERIARAIVVRK